MGVIFSQITETPARTIGAVEFDVANQETLGIRISLGSFRPDCVAEEFYDTIEQVRNLNLDSRNNLRTSIKSTHDQIDSTFASNNPNRNVSSKKVMAEAKFGIQKELVDSIFNFADTANEDISTMLSGEVDRTRESITFLQESVEDAQRKLKYGHSTPEALAGHIQECYLQMGIQDARLELFTIAVESMPCTDKQNERSIGELALNR